MTASDSLPTADHSWLQDNVLDPASTSLKETANAGINLVNLALSPTGAQLDKFEVTNNPQRSATAAAVSGLVSMVPYALAGGVVAKAMQWLPMSETAAVVLRSGAFAQIAGASGLDSLKDLRPGETTFGNVLGTATGFGVFELGNSRLRGLSLLAALPARAAVGVVGGITQSAFSDLGSGRNFDLSRWVDTGITSGGINVLLPTMQYAVGRALHLPMHMGEATVAARDAQAHLEQTAASALQVKSGLELVQTDATAAPLNEAHQGDVAPPPLAPAPKEVNLAELPAFAVLSNIGAHLKWEEQVRAVESPDLRTSTYAMRAMRNADEAKANMQQIAAGKLSPDTVDYIARGWLPADSLDQVQARLRSDLEAAHMPDSDTTNLEDLAAYGHQFTRDRPQANALIGQYQGSSTRLVLRALGIESPTLALLSDNADGLEIGALRQNPQLAHLQDVGFSETPGVGSVQLKDAQEARRALAAAERALANPQSREATLLDLKSHDRDLEALISKYAPADRGAARAPGQVDLSRYDSWNYAYRLLGRLQGQHDEGLNGMALQDASIWTNRALRHMEQIAKGDFPEAVLRSFGENPDVLNSMRAQLEDDLGQQYLSGPEPFSKQDDGVLWSQFLPLVQKYERSPLYSFLESTSGVPPQLTRVINTLRFNAAHGTPEDVDFGMKAVYALERGLLDPQAREGTLADLTKFDGDFAWPKLVSQYARKFDSLYAHEEPLGSPGDYSTVVRFPARTRSASS